MVRPLPALMLAAMLGTGPAAAQDTALGSRLKPREDVGVRTGRDALRETRHMSTCVVMKRTGAARQWLDAVTENDAEAWRRVLHREITCTYLTGDTDSQTGQRQFVDTDLERGFTAEALLAQSRYQTPSALPLEKDYASPWTAVSGRNVVVDEMAVCVAATNPAGVVALLATDVGGPQEMTEIRALSPSFGPCLSASAKLTANRPSLRAALAEAMYHRMNPPAVTASAAQK